MSLRIGEFKGVCSWPVFEVTAAESHGFGQVKGALELLQLPDEAAVGVDLREGRLTIFRLQRTVWKASSKDMRWCFMR
jgi:hypothetical protein